MIYKLYRKEQDEEAGQVLAVVAQKKKRVDIDDIEVYVFKNGNPVETDTYIGDAMKMTGEGRPIWSIVTWPSLKWKEIIASKDLGKWAKDHKAADNSSTVGNLNKFFVGVNEK